MVYLDMNAKAKVIDNVNAILFNKSKHIIELVLFVYLLFLAHQSSIKRVFSNPNVKLKEEQRLFSNFQIFMAHRVGGVLVS